MKKFFLSAMIALAFVQSQAQIIVNRYYSRPSRVVYVDRHHSRSHHHNDNSAATAAVVAAGAIGVAAIVGACVEHSAEVKAQREAEAARYEEEKVAAMDNFRQDLSQADYEFGRGDYLNALQNYAKCAKSNDKFHHSLGNQTTIVNRISQCNTNLGFSTSAPSVVNNEKARKADYKSYIYDIVNPGYKSSDSKDTRITRISRNNNETRIEMEYTNKTFGQQNVSIKPTTYIKGKNSGKLSLCRVENINAAPTSTPVLYGGQTLKYTLVFPALAPDEVVFTLCEPSTNLQFKNVTCR